MNTLPGTFTVILFYKFFRIEKPEAMLIQQRTLAESFNLKGRMLIAKEGINATLEGKQSDVEAYKMKLREMPKFEDIVIKESEGTGMAFAKLVVKVRSEVVTLGAGDFDIEHETAESITAADLQNMYETNEDFVVLDLRNDYETVVGKFDKTVDPGLNTFRDLPGKISELAHLRNKKVVTVCTGGIRCEKATCLLKREGFTNVVQLKDGIHSYMQQYPGSRFRGSLFVFDNRMVTPVVETSDRKVIGACYYCNVPSEQFYSNDSVRPSLKIICCAMCKVHHAELRSCIPV